MDLELNKFEKQKNENCFYFDILDFPFIMENLFVKIFGLTTLNSGTVNKNNIQK